MCPLRITEVKNTWNHASTSHKSSRAVFRNLLPFICFVVALAKLRKAIIGFVVSVCLSVSLSLRPRGKTRFPPDGFSCILTHEYFQKNIRV